MNLKNSTALYLACYIFFLLGTLVAFIVIVHNKNDQLIIASALFVTSGVLFSSAVKLHSEERDRAFKFFMENQKNDELLKSFSLIQQVVASNKFPLSKQQTEEIYFSKDRGDIKFIISLVMCVNFIEEMALAIRSKQANEAILKSFYRELVCSTIEDVIPFLSIIRNDAADDRHRFGPRKRPEALVHLEWLYKRWMKN